MVLLERQARASGIDDARPLSSLGIRCDGASSRPIHPGVTSGDGGTSSGRASMRAMVSRTGMATTIRAWTARVRCVPYRAERRPT